MLSSLPMASAIKDHILFGCKSSSYLHMCSYKTSKNCPRRKICLPVWTPNILSLWLNTETYLCACHNEMLVSKAGGSVQVPTRLWHLPWLTAFLRKNSTTISRWSNITMKADKNYSQSRKPDFERRKLLCSSSKRCSRPKSTDERIKTQSSPPRRPEWGANSGSALLPFSLCNASTLSRGMRRPSIGSVKGPDKISMADDQVDQRLPEAARRICQYMYCLLYQSIRLFPAYHMGLGRN